MNWIDWLCDDRMKSVRRYRAGPWFGMVRRFKEMTDAIYGTTTSFATLADAAVTLADMWQGGVRAECARMEDYDAIESEERLF